MAVQSRLDVFNAHDQHFIIGAGKIILEGNGSTIDFLASMVTYFNDLFVETKENVDYAEIYHPFQIQLAINSQPFLRSSQRVVFHKQHVHVDQGLFESTTTYATHHGKFTEIVRFFVDQKTQNQIIMEIDFSSEQPIHVEMKTGIFYTPNPLQVQHQEPFVLCRSELGKKGTKVVVAESMTSKPFVNYQLEASAEQVYRVYSFELQANKPVHFEKIVMFSHSDKAAYENPILRLERSMKRGIDTIQRQNLPFWKQAWKNASIDIKGDESIAFGIQRILYRLICTRPTTPLLFINHLNNSERTTVERHIHWLDLAQLPFYLNTDHDAANHIIERFVNTLPIAKRKAQQLGFIGAYFPPLSKDALDHAKNIAVGRAILDYYERTNDSSVLTQGGLETMLEIARFSARQITAQGQLLRVLTNDFRHKIVDNDIKTNYDMADFLKRFIHLVEQIRETNYAFYQTFSIKHEAKREIVTYKAALKRLYLPLANARGIYPMFEHYLSLVDKNIEWPSLFEVFLDYPHQFTNQIVKTNFEAYYPFLNHQFTRAELIAGTVSHQFELDKVGLEAFHKAIRNTKNPSPITRIEREQEEIAVYKMVVMGFAGFRLQGMIGRAISQLPSSISSLRFRVKHRNKVAFIKITKSTGQWLWENE